MPSSCAQPFLAGGLPVPGQCLASCAGTILLAEFPGENKLYQEGRFHLVVLNLLEQMHWSCHRDHVYTAGFAGTAVMVFFFFPLFQLRVAGLAKLCDCL